MTPMRVVLPCAAGVLLALAACSVSTSPTGAYACTATSGCPSGFQCLAERCEAIVDLADARLVPGDDAAPGGDAGEPVADARRVDAPLVGCLLEERFGGSLGADWIVIASGVGTAESRGGVLHLDVDADGAVVAATSASFDLRGRTVTIETPNDPGLFGYLTFHASYLQGGEVHTLGFSNGPVAYALGTCPTCAGGAGDTFCESTAAAGGGAFRYLRMIVGATDVVLESSSNGVSWVTRSTCAERITGLSSATLELGLIPSSGSVPSASATADDLSVCATE